MGLLRKLSKLLGGAKTPSRLYVEELLHKNRTYVNGLVLNVGGGKRTYRELAPRMVSIDRAAHADADVLCDLTAAGLPFRSAVFQAVICTSVLEHLSESESVVEEIHRVLAPNGSLVSFTPFLHKYHAHPHDYWRFTKEGVTRILHPFEIVVLLPVGGKLSLILHILRSSAWLAPVSALLFPLVKRVEPHLRDNEDWALGFFVIARKPDHQ